MTGTLLRHLLSRNLSGTQITDEKVHDFKRLTLIQGGVISTIFLLPVLQATQSPYHIEIAESLFFAILGVYVFLLWDMLRNYTSRQWLILLNLLFIMGVFFIGLMVANPFANPEPTPGYRMLLSVTQVCLLMVECTVIAYTLNEFFRKDLSLPMRLWGAACIYLMIGMAFGSAYELICIQDTSCLGVDIPLRTMALMKRFEYSLMVLSGMDSPYANPVSLIYSLGTIEALWGQLFIVLIVGRLMMK